MPTIVAVLKHMWDKCYQYLKKIGTVILGASIIIWFLSYFPRPTVETTNEQGEVVVVQAEASQTDFENSYLGRFGKLVAPVMAPLGLDWKASVAIIASLPAKEIAVSTLGVLYGNEDEDTLGDSLVASNSFTNASAFAFMVFMLLCFPCMATIGAIYGETGKKRWAAFSVIYPTVVAWVMAWIVFLIGSFVI